MAGERPSTEDDRHAGFMKGLQAVDAIERDKHEFVPGAPQWPDPIRIMPPEAILLAPPEPAPIFHGEMGRYEGTVAPEITLNPEHNPLDDIANMLRAATYGEMIELASEIWHFREVGEINQDTLPAILHGWAIQRGKSNGR